MKPDYVIGYVTEPEEDYCRAMRMRNLKFRVALSLLNCLGKQNLEVVME